MVRSLAWRQRVANALRCCLPVGSQLLIASLWGKHMYDGVLTDRMDAFLSDNNGQSAVVIQEKRRYSSSSLYDKR